MDCTLLVPHEDVRDFLLPEECVVEMQYRPARVSEYDLDALFLQRTDKDFGAGDRGWLGGIFRHGCGGS